MTKGILPGSFRDPSGFLFFRDGSVYRQVNVMYKENYEHLIGSGLYKTLVDSGLLIPHDEVSTDYGRTDDAYRVLKPKPIPFISYPYEWCFSQLKDAALSTLEVQKTALRFGMTLKDSSAYNIQFVGGNPVLIDTLSFERYCEGQIWVAYRQFCQHFLAPLALMSYRDVRLNRLFRVYIDGIPLDLASRLLPFRTWFKFPLLTHIHLHARSQERFADKTVNTSGREMSRMGFLGLIDNLESAVRGLEWRPQGTGWADYYEDTNYSEGALDHKRQLVGKFLDEIDPECVWDLGANTGLFSRVASNRGIQTVSFDLDPAAVEKNYLECVEKGEANILPLFSDLTNPSPSIGWENRERMSFLERGPAETVLALALVHHLVISNNLPLGRIASFFDRICNSLVIEFIPKTDSQVQRLLSTREDIFSDYTQEVFERAFTRFFTIQHSVKIEGTARTMYLMRK
jgi:ribosomal protein L11 methylase PrmA